MSTSGLNAFEKLVIRHQAAKTLIAGLLVAVVSLAVVLLVEILEEPERYIVYVDDLGVARRIEPLERLEDAETRFLVAELRRAVSNLRTVSTDPLVTSRRVSDALSFVAPGLRRGVLADLEESPARRDVDIFAFHALDAEDRFLIRWKETSYPQSVRDTPTEETWEAYVTVHLSSTVDEETLLTNPLGLVITHLSWTRVSMTDL